MVSQTNTSNELYNLRWNSYFSNLINVFTDHQNQETLVDVTLGCEGQFIKAHKLVLSACSSYFQKIFQTHTGPQHVLILLNDVKFENLQLVIQFMYKGEVKVADSEMPHFLQLGKMLQVKGLCSVELQDKTQSMSEKNNTERLKGPPEPEPEKNTNEKPETSEIQRTTPKTDVKPKEMAETPRPVTKKRKLSPVPLDGKKKVVSPVENKDISNTQKKLVISPSLENKDATHIPRPPNAFMIFANQWRKKLSVEYPTDSNKDISVRLGNMWKSLSPETRDAFYEDARKADEEHKLKYPGYYYSPMEARHRKAIANSSKSAQKRDSTDSETATSVGVPEFIDIKCEGDPDDKEYSTSKSNGS